MSLCQVRLPRVHVLWVAVNHPWQHKKNGSEEPFVEAMRTLCEVQQVAF